jgi:hypothetical protein
MRNYKKIIFFLFGVFCIKIFAMESSEEDLNMPRLSCHEHELTMMFYKKAEAKAIAETITYILAESIKNITLEDFELWTEDPENKENLITKAIMTCSRITRHLQYYLRDCDSYQYINSSLGTALKALNNHQGYMLLTLAEALEDIRAISSSSIFERCVDVCPTEAGLGNFQEDFMHYSRSKVLVKELGYGPECLAQIFQKFLDNQKAAALYQLNPDENLLRSFGEEIEDDFCQKSDHACAKKLLKIAAREGYTETVRFLLEDKGIDPFIENDYALRRACQNGHLEIVELLLNHGANPAALDDTPIRVAAKGGHTEIVRLLLRDTRVNPLACNNYALIEAQRMNHKKIVALLEAVIVKKYGSLLVDIEIAVSGKKKEMKLPTDSTSIQMEVIELSTSLFTTIKDIKIFLFEKYGIKSEDPLYIAVNYKRYTLTGLSDDGSLTVGELLDDDMTVMTVVDRYSKLRLFTKNSLFPVL